MHLLPGKYRFFLQLALCLALLAPANAQQAVRDTLPPLPAKILQQSADTIRPPADSLLARFRRGARPGIVDSLRPSPTLSDSAVVDLSKVRISKDAFEDVVDYGARDSMWLDVAHKQLHLYGGAFVKYTTIDLKGGYIRLDFDKNEVLAEQVKDSSGHLVELPEFKDRDQSFTATRLRYNFKSKKGIIYEARTQQEDLYVLGEKAKFIGAAGSTTDTSARARNTIYNQDAIITTCDAPHPHYGIHTQKLKVIPDKLVVTGFSNLEIGGVPLPLILPFGFYPITKTRKAGVIIPRDFEFRDNEGLGVKDFGWYQPFGEHADLTAQFRAYVSGSFGATTTLRYNHIYKYNGNLELDYNKRVTEDEHAEKLRATSFGIRFSHNQDPKAHPTRKFNGTVNIETNRNQSRNYNDYFSVHQNILSSNLNYTQSFPGTPFTLAAGLSHSQNTQTRQMDIRFPTAQLTMQRVYPFKRKVPSLKGERWYEKLSVAYNSRLENSFHAADTMLFTERTLQTARIGIQHEASSNYVFKIFRYISVTPNVHYEENWYPYKTTKRLLDDTLEVFNPVLTPEGDTLYVLDTVRSKFGILDTVRTWGFNAFRTYSAGINLNTSLFLTKKFSHGWLRGIRHKVTPNATLNFAPDYSNSSYFRMVDSDLRPWRNQVQTYSIFDEGPFGKPSLSEPNLAINYSLTNVLEFKHYSARRDSVMKKRIFDNLAFSGSYSLTADTLKWSSIGTGGLFRFFKGVTTLNWALTLDPYQLDGKGRRINRYLIKEEGRLLRMSNFNFSINTNCTVARLREIFSKKGEAVAGATPAPAAPSGPAPDDFIGWFERFNISHTIRFERTMVPGTARDTFVISTNSLNLSGNIPLSSKWTINIEHVGYDFPEKKITYPSFGITRDLHCWEMRLSWQPTHGTYEFYINVKPGSLDFLKLPYRKSITDAP